MTGSWVKKGKAEGEGKAADMSAGTVRGTKGVHACFE